MFVSASLIVLDFDDGEWGIQDAVDWLESLGLRGIVATTKSHMVPKGMHGAVERFRVVVDSVRCESGQDYRWTLKQLAAVIPCDPSCVDLARYFWPSVAVVHAVDGKPLGFLKSRQHEDDAETKREREVQMARRRLIKGDYTLLPPWVKALLFTDTMRNESLWKASRFMHDAGWDDDAILKELHRIGSPILTLERESPGEIERVIANARLYGNK